MRLHPFVLVPVLLTAAAAGARTQDPIEAVEKQLRERAALRLAAGDSKGAFELAENSASSSGVHEKFAGTLLLAELRFRSGERAQAVGIVEAWRRAWNPQIPEGALGPGDLVEVIDSEDRILERGIVGADGSLWHLGDRRVPKIALQRPESLDAGASEALFAHYGRSVQLRAWRTEELVLGARPKAAPVVQEEERVKQVRDLLAKTNLPRQSEKEASQLDALRRLGPAAMEAAEKIWMSDEEPPPVRVNAAYLIATEHSARLGALLPGLKQERTSGAAVVLLQAMEQGRGIPPNLAGSELRGHWLGLLESPSGDVRFRALSLYNAAFPSEIAAGLSLLAKDPDQRVRQLVAQSVLPRLAWNDAVLNVARALLGDRDATVRELAVRLLGERNQLRAEDALRILREDSSTEVRGQVIRQAGRAPGVLQGTPEELEAVLYHGLQDPNGELQSLAIDSLARGNVNPIRTRELAERLLERATSSDPRMRSHACMAMQFLDAPLLGPFAEEMLQRVPQQNWLESNVLTRWTGSQVQASRRFEKTELRPSIWLERREWMQADSRLADPYDEILWRFVISRLTAEDLPQWLPLLEEKELGDAILGQAITVDARLLAPVLEQRALPREKEEKLLRALAASKNPWFPELVLGRPELQRASVVRWLTNFSDRPEVQRFLGEWVMRKAPEEPQEQQAWRDTMKSLIGTFDNERSTENHRPWLIPVAVQQLARGDSEMGQIAAGFLMRQDADACLAELEKQLALFSAPQQIEDLHRLVSSHVPASEKAARFWVQHLAPLVERDAKLQDEGIRPQSNVAMRSAELRDLFARWERAESAKLRKWAAEFYRRGAVPDALERLLRMLEDKDADVRAQAAHSLRAFSDLRAVDALLKAQSDVAEGVRTNADESLKLLRAGFEEKRFWSTFRADGGEDPMAKIVPLLRDPDAEVRALAIDSLGALGSPRALPHLLELFKSGAEPEKSAARRAIERIQKAVDAERAKTEEAPTPAKKEETGTEKGDR